MTTWPLRFALGPTILLLSGLRRRRLNRKLFRAGSTPAGTIRSFLAAFRRRVNLRHGQAPLHRARIARELSRNSSRSQSPCEGVAVAVRRPVARNHELYRACQFDARGTVAGGVGECTSTCVLPADSRSGNFWWSSTFSSLGRIGNRTSPSVRAPQARPRCRASRGTGAGSQAVSSSYYSRSSERRVRSDFIAVLAAERGDRVRLMEGDRFCDVLERPDARRSNIHCRDAARVLDGKRTRPRVQFPASAGPGSAGRRAAHETRMRPRINESRNVVANEPMPSDSSSISWATRHGCPGRSMDMLDV
jgi:hypothetical protein